MPFSASTFPYCLRRPTASIPFAFATALTLAEGR
jgi:hypothetical protein